MMFVDESSGDEAGDAIQSIMGDEAPIAPPAQLPRRSARVGKPVERYGIAEMNEAIAADVEDDEFYAAMIDPHLDSDSIITTEGDITMESDALTMQMSELDISAATMPSPSGEGSTPLPDPSPTSSIADTK